MKMIVVRQGFIGSRSLGCGWMSCSSKYEVAGERLESPSEGAGCMLAANDHNVTLWAKTPKQVLSEVYYIFHQSKSFY